MRMMLNEMTQARVNLHIAVSQATANVPHGWFQAKDVFEKRRYHLVLFAPDLDAKPTAPTSSSPDSRTLPQQVQVALGCWSFVV